MTVSAVLWDADGVLQQVPGSWATLLTDIIGEERTRELLTDAWPIAQDAMCGRADMRVELEKVLAQHGVTDVADQIHEVWGSFDTYDESRALVTEVRTLGVDCHLATNQDQLRASYMRERLGYDELFDSSFYSCEMGVAKPDPGYFTHIAGRLGLTPDQLIFIDDTEANVESANGLGVHGIHWHARDGIESLRTALRAVGVPLED